MYGPSYGFGSPPADESSPFNHPHQPHHQQQGQQGQEGQQLPQHMMYNPQAYGAAPQQPMYDASGAAAMGGSPDGMAMTPQQDVGGMAGVHLPGGGKSFLFLSRMSLPPARLSRHISLLLEPSSTLLLSLGQDLAQVSTTSHPRVGVCVSSHVTSAKALIPPSHSELTSLEQASSTRHLTRPHHTVSQFLPCPRTYPRIILLPPRPGASPRDRSP